MPNEHEALIGYVEALIAKSRYEHEESRGAREIIYAMINFVDYLLNDNSAFKAENATLNKIKKAGGK